MKYPECPVCGVSRPALEEEMAQPPGSDARCQAECIITSCHCCLSWWQEQERQAIEEHLNHWQEIERHYQERGEDPPAGVVGLRRKWEKRKQDIAEQERIEQEQAYRRAMFHVPKWEVKA